VDDLRFAEARFRVWRDRDAIAALVDAAVALLVAGADAPNLRILAGEDHAEPDEVEVVLDATLSDLGLDPLDRLTAILSVAEELAQRVIGDEGAATEVAPILWRLFAREPMGSELPPAFVRLAYAADAVEDLPWLDESLPAFLAAARDFVASPD
jgi:hypothetical protein